MIDKIIQLISFIFFGIALWLIVKEVELVGAKYLWGQILSTPLWVIGVAVLIAGVNFTVLSGYDITALEYIHKSLPYRRILEASSIGFAISNTSGHAYVAGGSVRYLFYLPQGLTRAEIIRVIAFESLTILMGMGAAYVLAVGLAPYEKILSGISYLKALYWSAGGVVAGFVLYYLIWVRRGKNMSVAGHVIEAPSPILTLKQIMVGLGDNITLFLCFYILLRYHIHAPIIPAFMVFIIAQTIGLTTQVPGGIGVFEGTFLYLFPHTGSDKSGILASLALFRVLYYFLPFIMASLYLGGWFVMRRLKPKN